jgi:hypothetical protein
MRRTFAALAFLFLLGDFGQAQQLPPEPEWMSKLPQPPAEIVQKATALVRDNFGAERFDKLFRLHWARTLPGSPPDAEGVHHVVFAMRVQATDYAVELPVGVQLDASGNVLRTEGVVDCGRLPDGCPPFDFTRAQAIQTAREAGLKPGAKPLVCSPAEFIEGFCVTLYFHHGHGRYVWSVRNRESRGWRFWEALLYPAGYERGRDAIIDAGTRKLYGVYNWRLILD